MIHFHKYPIEQDTMVDAEWLCSHNVDADDVDDAKNCELAVGSKRKWLVVTEERQSYSGLQFCDLGLNNN